MYGPSTLAPRTARLAGVLVALVAFVAAVICAGAASSSSAAATTNGKAANPTATFSWDVAHDVSPPLRDLARNRIAPDAEDPANEPDRGPLATGDGPAG